jgi:hypothetical protein
MEHLRSILWRDREESVTAARFAPELEVSQVKGWPGALDLQDSVVSDERIGRASGVRLALIRAIADRVSAESRQHLPGANGDGL